MKILKTPIATIFIELQNY